MQIYAVRNTLNDKVYVGYTTQTLAKRFACHKSEARNDGQTKLWCAMRQLGIEHFYIETLVNHLPSLQAALDMEKQKIIELDSIENGYNELRGWDGVGDRYRGKHIPDHVKKALHEGQMKRIAEQGGPNLGREFSDEWRENISLGKRGVPNLKKRKLTDEQRRLILSDSRPLRHVAKDYGVNHKTILRIKRGA